MNKAFGLFKEGVWNEVRTTTVIIWIVCAGYIACGFCFRNPLFGAVFLHVLNALRCQSKQSEVNTNVYIIMAIYGIWIIGLTIWLSIEAKNNTPGNFGLFK